MRVTLLLILVAAVVSCILAVPVQDSSASSYVRSRRWARNHGSDSSESSEEVPRHHQRRGRAKGRTAAKSKQRGRTIESDDDAKKARYLVDDGLGPYGVPYGGVLPYGAPIVRPGYVVG